MKAKAFDRSEHVYRSDAFTELVKDAVRFFNGTPVIPLPPPESFTGTGVYALYYTGPNPLYKKYSELNRLAYNYPIYVGKAVPLGWRQSRVFDSPDNQSKELLSRLREHSRNITAGKGIETIEFMCRFVIFESDGSDMISTIEAALIRLCRPLWNVGLDGFGNHTPGKGRFQQAKSDWDLVHPGRSWAEKCTGEHSSVDKVLKNIKAHMETVGIEK